MYIEFEAGNRTYKLRLTTRGIVQLEKDLGCNPLQIFMGIDEDVLPKVSDLITVTHAMLQPYEHGIRRDDTIEILEKYIEDGHTYWDLIPTLIEVFVEAGFLPKSGDEEKN